MDKNTIMCASRAPIDLEGSQPKWINSAVFNRLQGYLMQYIGPIAQLIIEEEVRGIGYDLQCLPENRYGELIEGLALFIPHPEKRELFQQQARMLIHEERMRLTGREKL